LLRHVLELIELLLIWWWHHVVELLHLIIVSIVHRSRTKAWTTKIARHWILHWWWLLHHHRRRILHLKTHHFSLIDFWSSWRRLPWPSSRSFLAIRIVIHLSLQLLSLSSQSLLFLSFLIFFLLFDLLRP